MDAFVAIPEASLGFDPFSLQATCAAQLSAALLYLIIEIAQI